MSRPTPAVGIDFGTTHSVVAAVDDTGSAVTIRNGEGGLTTPSVVFLDDTGPIVGTAAIEAGRDEPERLASLVKREVGQRHHRNSIVGHRFPPEVLQSLLFQRLRRDAEVQLAEVDQAVFAVPSFFNEPCRKATEDAAQLAGLEVVGMINEPMAAALCFGVQHGFATTDSDRHPERVLVYDLGAGKLDVAVIEVHGRAFRTLASGGDLRLGGMEWDRTVANHLADLWMAQYGDDPQHSAVAEQDLLRKAQQAKHALSQRESVAVPFSFGGNRIRAELTRRQLEEMTKPLVQQTITIVESVLDAAAVPWSELTRVILVGGSTRMPMIGNALSRRCKVQLDRSLSAEEAVAHGAAIYAAIQLGMGGETLEGISISDVNSHDLGVLARDPQEGHPRRQVMIAKNTSLPASHCVRFRTHQDGQQNVKIEVVEGGDDQGRDATAIGKCLVEDLPQNLPKGTFVDIRFDYSQDGRLAVTATLPDLQRTAKMSLDRASGMTEKRLEHWKAQINRGIVLAAKERTKPDEREPIKPQKIADHKTDPSPSSTGMPSAESESKSVSKSGPPSATISVSSATESTSVIKLVRKPPPAQRKSRQDDWRSRRQPFGPQGRNE